MLHLTTVEYIGQMIQEWMDDEWTSLFFRRVCVRKSGNGRWRTHVFGQEYRPPADLRAQVLDHHLASITHTRRCENGIVPQWFGIALERESLSFDVELCRSGACGCESDERQAKLKLASYPRELCCQRSLYIRDFCDIRRFVNRNCERGGRQEG